MSHPTHHLFLSYSRKDNKTGWVTAFYNRLQSEHRKYSGRELRIFFDQSEIDDGADWEIRLAQGLRSSRLFLAFLSPNYIKSKNCRWEFTEYLRREHVVARGDDGVAVVYFELVPGMPGELPLNEQERVKLLQTELNDDQKIADWLEELRNEMSRRQMYVDSAEKRHPQAALDLRTWFSYGPDVLREIDAAERLAELRQNPKADDRELLTLAERLTEVDRRIANRLDRCLLAELAPGNLARSYEHFVGRHRELRDLRTALTSDSTGLITAAHGLGGQGKTALAIQYAHAYAEFYAAGGRWLISCAGKVSLAEALLELARSAELEINVPDNVRGDEAARYVLHGLKTFTEKNAAAVAERLARHPERESGDDSRLPQFAPQMLLILDNVDQPALLQVDQTSLLPQAAWLEVLVTTRLDPRQFGATGRSMKAIAVDSLPIDDAVSLIRDYQPHSRFSSAADEAGSQQLAAELGGYTLSVELAAAHLGAHPEVRPDEYLRHLLKEGLPANDRLAGEVEADAVIRHRDKQLGLVLQATLSTLANEPAYRAVLELASLMPADQILSEWLRHAAIEEHPSLEKTEPGRPDPWLEVWRRLEGLRLLTTVEEAAPSNDPAARQKVQVPTVVRLHRLVGAHLRTMLSVNDRHRYSETLESVLQRRATEFDQTVAQLMERAPDSGALSDFSLTTGRALINHGQLHEADAAYRRAHRVLFDLWQRDPRDANSLFKLCITLHSVGLINDSAGKFTEAEDCFTKAMANLEALWQANPSHFYVACMLVRVQWGLAALRLRDSRPAEAEQLYRNAAAIIQPLHAQEPSNLEAGTLLVGVMGALAGTLSGSGKVAEAEEAYRKAIKVGESLFAMHNQSVDLAVDLSWALQGLGQTRQSLGDTAAALELYRRAYDLCTPLWGRREDTRLGVIQAECAESLGLIHREKLRLRDAEFVLRECIRVRQYLYDRNPADAGLARGLSQGFHKLALTIYDTGNWAELEQHSTRAFTIAREILERNPRDRFAAQQHAISLLNHGWFLDQQGRFADAQQLHREAFRLLAHLARSQAPDSIVDDCVSRALNNYAFSLYVCGDLRKAERLVFWSVRRQQQLCDVFPDDIDLVDTWGYGRRILARVLSATARSAAAIDILRETARLLVRRSESGAFSKASIEESACVLHELANHCSESGQLEEARLHYLEAVNFASSLILSESDDPWETIYIATAAQADGCRSMAASDESKKALDLLLKCVSDLEFACRVCPPSWSAACALARARLIESEVNEGLGRIDAAYVAASAARNHFSDLAGRFPQVLDLTLGFGHALNRETSIELDHRSAKEALERSQQAIRHWRSLFERHADHFQVAAGLAQALSNAGECSMKNGSKTDAQTHLDESIRLFDHLRKLEPTHWRLTLGAARALIAMCRVREARPLLGAVLTVVPRHSSALQLSAIANRRRWPFGILKR